MPDEWQLPVTRQLGALDQLVQQCLREAVVLVREVAPVEQHRHAGDFPVARRRVFTGRELAGVSVSADDVGVAVQPLREVAGGLFRRFTEAQTAQVRQRQRPPAAHIGLTARANLGDVARGVGTRSPKRSASSLAPMPKESNTIINVRFICALLRVLTLLRPQNCNRPYSLNLYPMDFKL